ncbi:ABC transporter permease [Mesorhizobium sp. M2A.F.Ca.ET.040.01.1.1]|nr:ABC transporter permease [Mesorhizobium sp. M2A.F.Ca.ET.040.01.1.1]
MDAAKKSERLSGGLGQGSQLMTSRADTEISFRGPWLAAVPWYMILIAFFALPSVWLIVLSLTGTDASGGNTFPSLANYHTILDPEAGQLRILIRTLTIGSIVVLLSIVLAVPVAYYLAKCLKSVRLEALTLTIFAGAFFLGPLVRTVSWRGILGINGVINYALVNVGLIEQPLLSLLYGWPAMIAAMTYNVFLFMLFTTYLAMKMVDNRYVAAARDLGASPTTAFWRIVIPLSAPGLLVGSVLVAVPTLSAVLESEMLGGTSARVTAAAIRDQFFRVHNWPQGAAITVVLVVAGSIAIGLLIGLIALFTRLSGHAGISLAKKGQRP